MNRVIASKSKQYTDVALRFDNGDTPDDLRPRRRRWAAHRRWAGTGPTCSRTRAASASSIFTVAPATVHLMRPSRGRVFFICAAAAKYQGKFVRPGKGGGFRRLCRKQPALTVRIQGAHWLAFSGDLQHCPSTRGRDGRLDGRTLPPWRANCARRRIFRQAALEHAHGERRWPRQGGAGVRGGGSGRRDRRVHRRARSAQRRAVRREPAGRGRAQGRQHRGAQQPGDGAGGWRRARGRGKRAPVLARGAKPGAPACWYRMSRLRSRRDPSRASL